MMWSRKSNSDRRIQRTERLLHEALGALMHEKPYDAIAVKEILGRADVGRSTFYSHFHDKDELLVSGILAMLESGHAARRGRPTVHDDPLWFSRVLFEQIDQRHRGRAMPDRGWSEVHGLLRGVVEQLVADEMKRYGSAGDTGRVPSELIARHAAVTFVLVLDWWVESGGQLSAALVDEHYRALMQPVLTRCTSPA
jgi:AcrR family transcriptional regulator